MLIFSSVGTHAAATGRVIDTLVGAAAGLGGGLIFAGRPRVQPARSAVGRLAGQVAGLLDRMASDLADDEQEGTALEGSGNDLTGEAAQWLTQARTLRDEIERVDDTLREAVESAKLNPRALVTPAGTAQATETTVALRGGLEALEHAALTLRGLARSVLDSAGIATKESPVRDRCTRVRLASVLAKLGEAIRTYGRLVQLTPAGDESLESELAAELEEAHGLQDELADLLKPRIGDGGEPSEWPLRGEILTHVDRLRTGLSNDAVDALAHVERAAARKRRPRPRPRPRTGTGTAERRTLPQPRLRPRRQLLRRASRSRSSAHRAR
jgi:hypothetical protein